MASEVLAIPEEHLADFVLVLREGLTASGIAEGSLTEHLDQWCDEVEEYLAGMSDDDDDDDET